MIEGVGPLRPVDGPNRPRRSRRMSRLKLSAADSVELSDAARMLAKMDQTSPLRGARLKTISSELAEGAYVTDDRLLEALENLLAEADDLTKP